MESVYVPEKGVKPLDLPWQCMYVQDFFVKIFIFKIIMNLLKVVLKNYFKIWQFENTLAVVLLIKNFKI